MLIVDLGISTVDMKSLPLSSAKSFYFNIFTPETAEEKQPKQIDITAFLANSSGSSDQKIVLSADMLDDPGFRGETARIPSSWVRGTAGHRITISMLGVYPIRVPLWN